MDHRQPLPIVLLGAGASRPAGVPTSVEMTRRMMEMCEEERQQDYLSALNAISGGLQMVGQSQAAFSGDVDVERVMNAAILLGDRFNLEFAPFVATWVPIIEELDRRRFGSLDPRQIVRQASALSLPRPRQQVSGTRGHSGLNGGQVEAFVERAFDRLREHLAQRPAARCFEI